MVNSADKLCDKCGKLINESSVASMTQWIFSSQMCTCNFTNFEAESGVKDETKCDQCGLAIRGSRHGSMTQWIFGGKSCTCMASTLILEEPDTGSTEQASLSDEDLFADEPELEISQSGFPLKRYKPLTILGKGATGAIYLARDRILTKEVAVKVLHQLTEQQMLSFQTEARATSKLNHPNILTIFDFGPNKDGTPYMVFEYFKGMSLEQYFAEKKTLSVEEAKDIFLQITSALAHAHENGVYHRDMKPANVIFSADDEKTIKLIDFGIAQMKVNQFETFAIKDDTVVGTPAYMSADILQMKSYDQRSEVYAIGCMLYEALSGSVPFQGVTPLDTMRMHAEEPVKPLSETVSSRDIRRMEPIVLKCLEKDPDKRYQSMEELHDALGSFGLGFKTLTESIFIPGPKRRIKRLPVVMLCSFTLILAGLIYLNYTGGLKYKKHSNDNATQKNTNRENTRDKELVELEISNRSIDQIRHSASKGNKKDQYILALAYSEGLKGLKVDKKKAYQWMRKSAENNYIKAQIELGHMIITGFGVKQNVKEGKSWILKAALQGDPLAMHDLGDLYYMAGKTEEDKRAAFVWHNKAASNGNSDSIHQIGTMYHYGVGVKKDYNQARKFYKQAEEKGVPEATHQLALMYERGEGVSKNYDRAIKGYHKAAVLGVPEADVQIGNMYLYGHGVEKDPGKAMIWFQKAADKDYYLAYSQIGQIYEHGLGVKQDYAKAKENYELAARNGIPQAMNQLGLMYQFGFGIKRDYKKAMELFKSAAQMGLPTAENQIGLMYYQGQGVKKDKKLAAKLFRKAALKGLSVSQLSYGSMLIKGEGGLQKNISEGMTWMQKSALQGYVPASEELARIYEHGDFGVAKDISKAIRWYKVAAKAGSAEARENIEKLQN